MALRLQNRLALAQFKTKHGWEDLTLDSIEPKFEKELRRQRLFAVADAGGGNQSDVFSDSSSSGSDHHQSHRLPSYPNARVNGLMSSPLKAPLFSDDVHGSGGSIHGGGSRKRSHMQTFDGLPLLHSASSPSKRLRPSGAHSNGLLSNGTRSFGGLTNGNAMRHGSSGSSSTDTGADWKSAQQFSQSSPVRHHQPLLPRTTISGAVPSTTATTTAALLHPDDLHTRHFTTRAGPDLSFFAASSSRRNRRNARLDSSPAYAPADSDDDENVDGDEDGSSSAATDTTRVDDGAAGGGVDDREYNGNGVVATADILRSSPPRTPPMHPLRRPMGRGAANGAGQGNGTSDSTPVGNANGGLGAADTADGERHHDAQGAATDEGADLLIFLKTTPSPAVRAPRRGSGVLFGAGIAEPSTPPSRITRSSDRGAAGSNSNLDLPSSMLNTPGPSGVLGFPNTPGQAFDFSDFVNITPSPAQKPWKTPVTGTGGRTPRSVARRMLTYN